jgi:hypothetical protein
MNDNNTFMAWILVAMLYDWPPPMIVSDFPVESDRTPPFSLYRGWSIPRKNNLMGTVSDRSI